MDSPVSKYQRLFYGYWTVEIRQLLFVEFDTLTVTIDVQISPQLHYQAHYTYIFSKIYFVTTQLRQKIINNQSNTIYT